MRSRLRVVLLATTLVPLFVLAYLLYGAGGEGGAVGRSITILLVATVLGLAVGGWLMAALSRALPPDRSASGSPSAERQDSGAEIDSVAHLRVMVAQQTAEIARTQERLAETLKELETTNTRLKETSFKDELTSLYNRRFLFVRLEEEISRHRRFGHPVAVVLFDLDGFKEVNDEQGHLIGDETLRDIGQVLMKYSRGINVVARYGGDEFSILLVETSKAGATLYAERIRQIISNYPYAHGMRITASFGVASLPEDEADTSEELVRIADEALYVAKRGGKNQVAGARPPEE